MIPNRQSINAFFLSVVFLFSFVGYAQKLELSKPEEVGMSSERLERITSNFEDYINMGQLPGVVVMITRKGKIAYFKSIGKQDVENNLPMQNNTIFRIASQTKAITSVGVMMLQEEGKLLITDPIGKYLPSFKETTVAVKNDAGEIEIVKAQRSITIHDLLTHTAGIGYGWGAAKEYWKEAGIQGWYFADRKEPIQETISRIGDIPFDAQLGGRFEYGYNTDILGALIEVVSGETLDVFMSNRIFKPLGMNDTYFYLPKDKGDRLSVVYSATDQGLKRAPDGGGMVMQGEYVNGPRKSFSGGAGLVSTAYDYAVFLQMLLNNGEYDGKRIISRKTVELMTISYIDKDRFPWDAGKGFGLGFRVTDNVALTQQLGSVGNYGWGGAYHSTYWVDPKEELTVVYFTQLIPDMGLDDHAKLGALVYQSLID